jgi:putative hydrolase of the HAD superfamily
MQYKHIFWDLDHTLWDFEKNSSVALSEVYYFFQLAEKGLPVFDEFSRNYHHHNEIMWDKFRKGLLSREDLKWKRMYITLQDYQIFDESLSKGMAEKYLEFLPKQNFVFDGAIEVLSYLQQKGYQQHMITNGFELTQIEKMTNSKILPFIDKLITSEVAMSMKPKPEIFQYAIDAIAAKAEECIMIGDGDDVDVLGAVQFGMDAIFFNPINDNKSAHKAITVHSLWEIKSVL